MPRPLLALFVGGALNVAYQLVGSGTPGVEQEPRGVPLCSAQHSHFLWRVSIVKFCGSLPGKVENWNIRRSAGAASHSLSAVHAACMACVAVHEHTHDTTLALRYIKVVDGWPFLPTHAPEIT